METASDAGKSKFDAFEAVGVTKEAKATAFVLVAGGLGERLDYPGIKVALPSEISSGKSYLQLYIEHILALQSRVRTSASNLSEKVIKLPLVIMTSDDTDVLTRKLLADHKSFGMDDDQLTIVVQEKVPALRDNAAHFAVSPADPYTLNTKPHGHGDVHTLLYRAGLVQKWSDAGRKWIVFFQDTNGLVFRAIPAALGVSATLNMAVNSLTVSRKPGEAVGAIMRLEKKSGDAKTLTINVEYNQLEALVKAEPLDANGFSVYPGNINVLILGIARYLTVLKTTSGIISEFINPKYKDASSKTTFKKDTRLECMMQDYPKLLQGTDAIVGFTQFERWLAFSAVKNSLSEAKAKQTAKLPIESASSGEADMYYVNRRLLVQRCGVNVAIDGEPKEFAGLVTPVGARVVWSPLWATTQAEVMSKVLAMGTISISPRSTLILSGQDITIKSLKLDGTLTITSVPGAKVVVDQLNVTNKGWEFVPFASSAPSASASASSDAVDAKYSVRGYALAKHGALNAIFDSPGQFLLSDTTTKH